jgi:hypothetical protein
MTALVDPSIVFGLVRTTVIGLVEAFPLASFTTKTRPFPAELAKGNVTVCATDVRIGMNTIVSVAAIE